MAFEIPSLSYLIPVNNSGNTPFPVLIAALFLLENAIAGPRIRTSTLMMFLHLRGERCEVQRCRKRFWSLMTTHIFVRRFAKYSRQKQTLTFVARRQTDGKGSQKLRSFSLI